MVLLECLTPKIDNALTGSKTLLSAARQLQEFNFSCAESSSCSYINSCLEPACQTSAEDRGHHAYILDESGQNQPTIATAANIDIQTEDVIALHVADLLIYHMELGSCRKMTCAIGDPYSASTSMCKSRSR